MGKPEYYSDNVHLSNPESNTAIVCLWTKKERIIEKLAPENYRLIGQLYSKDYGLQILIRNLLATPGITDLIVTGIDLNKSSEGLINFFEKGTDNHGKIVGTNIYLDEHIKKEHIKLLRENIKLHDLRNIKSFEELSEYLEKIPGKKPYGQPIKIELPQIIPPARFPSDGSGFKARGKTFADAYQSLLRKILRFGYYNHEEKELSITSISVFIKKFSDEEKKFFKLRKPGKARIKKYEDKNILLLEEAEAWEGLKDVFAGLTHKENLSVMIGKAYLKEKDIESAIDTLDNHPKTLKWDPDPHGNIVIRTENNFIIVNHFDQEGKLLDEFKGSTAKELYRKIDSEDRISMLYHALDIGAELFKAEQALKQGKKYEQDKPL